MTRRSKDLGKLLIDKAAPYSTAKKVLTDAFSHPDARTLLHALGGLYRFDGTAYREYPDDALRSFLYAYLDRHRRFGQDGDGGPFKPTKADVDGVRDALKGLTYTATSPPAWLDDEDRRERVDPRHLLIARNGVFDLRDDKGEPICRPTPALFATSYLDFDYDPDPPKPEHWFAFLQTVWRDDPESVVALRMFMGYTLTADTSQQKAMLMVGPTRSGKGTIARVWRELIGADNVCGPTLSSLATNFGLWPLVDKPLAVVSDARLSGRADLAIIVERILSITGEDAITIDRKNLQPITLRLPTRLVILTNELPRLADSSGALANRFIILRFRESFLGREDTGLTDRLILELPGILMWAIQGWRELQEHGRLFQPAAGREAVYELMDLASPVGAFVREWCEVKPDARIPQKKLFDAWGAWCRTQGRDHPGPINLFARNLRAAVAGIDWSRPRLDGEQVRYFEGIDLQPTAEAEVLRVIVHSGGMQSKWNWSG